MIRIPGFLLLISFILTSCYTNRWGKWYTKDDKLVDIKEASFLEANYICLREAQQPFEYSVQRPSIALQPAVNSKQRMANAFIGGFNSGYNTSVSTNYIETNTGLYNSCMQMKGFFWIEDKNSKLYFG